MNKHIKRWLRKIKYALYYGIKPVVKLISLDGISFKIILHPIKNGGIDIVIFNTGEWEPHVVNVFKSYVKPGDVFVDVGANIGYHSLFISALLNEQCVVHSFEPQKDIYNQFKKSIVVNGFSNINLHNYGLANEDHDREIVIRDENIGSSSLLADISTNPLVISGRESVTLKKMDDVLKKERHISFIKIDVEGFEYEVLKGAENILRQHKPVILFEYSPFLYKSINEDLPYKILSYLNDIGYTFTDIIRDEQFLVTDDLYLYQQRDLLCVFNKK